MGLVDCRLLILFLLILCSCNDKKLLKENEELKIDTMLQKKTIDRLFKEKDSLENIILLDSLKNIK